MSRDDEDFLLRSVALQNASSILSARRRAEEELVRTQEALREETRILEVLNETGNKLGSLLDLQEIVQEVTDAGTALSGAEFGAFVYNTTDERGDAFLPYALSGIPREAFENFRKPRAAALFGPTLRGEGVVRLDDMLTPPRSAPSAADHRVPSGPVAVRSYLAVPVKSRTGEIHGGLFFGHSQPAVFTPRTERLMVGLAAQAGIAIDNARLYEAAQQATHERQNLLELERTARTAAERLSEAKDEFLATLSHELRTPLGAILGWAQLLRSGAKSTAEYVAGLETIERNARVQLRLIEDLLDTSRVGSGKIRLDIQPVHPIWVVEAAIESLRPAADAKGIRVEKILDPGAGPISADPNRLQQVVWNLLSNAVKFTPRAGRVQVLLQRVDSHVEISVADTGIGLTPEFRPHLFERFSQRDASTTRKFGGLGLGLSIVKSLVELHGGTVVGKSDGEGRGTTVVVTLPLSVVHRSVDDAPRQHPLSSSVVAAAFLPTELAGLRILVVDDDADARVLIRRVLEECSATVFTAESVEQAVLLVEAERPDLIVSDIGMPDADGYELLKRVRALGPERGGRAPAIALTAFARAEDRTRALRAGFLVHVAKPVDPSELVATVASVAGRTGER